VAVILTAVDNDGGSGVDRITYAWDGGAPVVVKAATATAELAVDTATHTDDGAHTLAYRATDKAGNVESLKTLTVNVDTQRPATQALAAAARRGRTATLVCKVVDPAPNSGKAAVVIKVRNRAGKVVKVLRAGKMAVNVLQTRKLTVPRTWKPGTYRFFVYAVDAAGNHQLTAASNRLNVK
jgi:hypothetical protein